MLELRCPLPLILLPDAAAPFAADVQFLLGRKVREGHPLSAEEQRTLFTAPVRVSNKSKSKKGGAKGVAAAAAHAHAHADADADGGGQQADDDGGGDGQAQQQMLVEEDAAAGAALAFGLPLLPHPAQMAGGAQLHGVAGDGPAPMEF